MALPTIIAENQTAGDIFLSRVGLTVGASSTLTLTDYAFVDEIYNDESLHAAILADEILLNFGSTSLTKGESLKFFNIQTDEVRIPVKALSDSNIASLTGTTTIDDIPLSVGDRLLLTGQGTTSQNGIYVIGTPWVRPDDMGTGQSAAGALITVGQGTTYADQLWQCSTNLGSDVVGTNGLTFAQITGSGGGGGTLQQAYVAGNTITTNTTDGDVEIGGTEALTVTTASADIDATGTLTFDATTSITIGGDADTSTIDIGTSASARTITIGNATSTTALDLNSGTGGTLIDSTGVISLDGVGASNFTTSTGDLTLQATAGSAIVTGGEAVADAVQITASNGAGGVDVDAGTGGITLDSTGAISLDGVGASNFTTDTGALAFVTTTSGSITVDGIDGIAINSSAAAINIGDDAVAQAINVGTGAAVRTITVGNATGATQLDLNSGTGGTLLDSTGIISLDGVGNSDFTTDMGDLTLSTTTSGGVLVSSAAIADIQAVGAVTIDSSGALIGIGTDDNDFAINIGTNGERVITLGNNTGVTGVAIETGTGNLLIDAPLTTLTGNLYVTGTTFTAESEIVNIADQFLYLNDGYTINAAQEGGFVVNSLPTTNATTVDTGGFTAAVALTTDQIVRVADASVFTVGSYVQVSGAAEQTNDGLYQVSAIDTGTTPDILSLAGVGANAPTYNFVQNDFTTDTTAQGAVTEVTVGVEQVDTSGNLQYGYDDNSTTFTFNNLITAATLTLQGAYDGGQTITTDGSGVVLIAGTQKLQVTATSGLDVDTIADFNVTTFDVQMTGVNGYSIDGTADSNLTATNTVSTTDITNTVAAANTGATSGDATVAISATSTNGSGIVNIDADDSVNVDVLSGGAINIGTNTVASTTTVGNNTGASGVAINSGTEQVEIDGVTYYGSNAGLPTATGSGFQDGDKFYDTDLDAEMRYDATRGKWLSVEALYIQFGRNGYTTPTQYYRGINGRVMSSTLGYTMPYAGTIVGLGYTRSDSDVATFEVVEGGSATGAELTSSAVKGKSNALNSNLSADGVLAVRNKSASAVTANVMAWVKVKWRSV